MMSKINMDFTINSKANFLLLITPDDCWFWAISVAWLSSWLNAGAIIGHIIQLYPKYEGIILGVILLIKKKVWHFELLTK